jgi:glycosyltransferase involved in cell wall biosynthesis
MSKQGSTEQMGVTVVIPAFNYERYVREAVASCLAQDYPGPVEVLVVDDGSTDGTAAVVREFGDGVRYHWKENAGLSAARNTGMELARYEWVVFLDADDVLEPGAIRRMVEVRALQEGLVVVGTLGKMIDGDGALISADAEGDGRLEAFTPVDFVQRNRFPPIVLADRRVLLSLGGFDPELKASEDRDMWIRAGTAGKVLRLNERLHLKRDHGGNMSRQATRQTASILQVVAKAEANPAVILTSGELRQARAVCLFQSARMHLAAGDRAEAVRQCLRSIRARVWVRHPERLGLPKGFRIKFLMLRLLQGWRKN